jgi:hypothetical protein
MEVETIKAKVHLVPTLPISPASLGPPSQTPPYQTEADLREKLNSQKENYFKKMKRVCEPTLSHICMLTVTM